MEVLDTIKSLSVILLAVIFNKFPLCARSPFSQSKESKGSFAHFPTARETKDSVRNRVLSRAKAPTDINMEILSNRGGRIIKLDQVPILASLPVPERYFIDKKAGKNLRILVREAFYRKMKRNYVKNPYIHPVSQRNLKTGAKKRKILYNAPVDWKAKPEDLVIKTGGER